MEVDNAVQQPEQTESKGPTSAEDVAAYFKAKKAASTESPPEPAAEATEAAPAVDEKEGAAVSEGDGEEAKEEGSEEESKPGRAKKMRLRAQAAERSLVAKGAELDEAVGHAEHFMREYEVMKAENDRLRGRLTEYDIPEDPKDAKLQAMERELASLRAQDAANNTRKASQAAADQDAQVLQLKAKVEEVADTYGLKPYDLGKSFMVSARSGVEMTLDEVAKRMAIAAGLGDKAASARTQAAKNNLTPKPVDNSGPPARVATGHTPRDMLAFLREKRKVEGA